MNAQEIEKSYRNVVELIGLQRLKEAQAALAELIDDKEWTLRSRLDQQRTSYDFMLHYIAQGADDPHRQVFYQKLLAETLEIADQARVLLMDDCSTRYYNTLHKSRATGRQNKSIAELMSVLEAFQDVLAVSQLTGDAAEAIPILVRHEEAARELFLATWSNSCWTSEEREQAGRLLGSETMYVNDVCLFVSAVTMSLTECFDARKFAWLTDAVTHADTQVRQRALVGIVITLMYHAPRFHLYPELTARLSLLDEDVNFGRQLNRIYIELLRSQETEKIDRRMREEIIPEVMKSVEKMRDLKFDICETPDENDRNPDWEEVFEKSGLGDKLREMTDWQMEGADMYMDTFAHFKNYPFFQQLPNWFYPFDLRHSEVVKLTHTLSDDARKLYPPFMFAGFFCNNDLYSSAFLMSKVSQKRREDMLQQMDSDEMREFLDSDEVNPLKNRARQAEVICNQYVHDLYRFFKLNPHKQEFHDFFTDELSLHTLPVLRGLLCKPELLRAVAEFHFKSERLSEAYKLYKEIIDLSEADADIYQKAGYCLQKEKRYGEAIDNYLRADILRPDNLWTNRHLATCYRMTRDYRAALSYYKQIEAAQPENRQVLFYAGSCLAELGRYDEALQYFYKLDFMDSDNPKAWRAIAWCLFLCGKHKQATGYYEKILAHEPTAADFLNAAHSAWAAGDTNRAAGLYRRSAQATANPDLFREMFEKDRAALVAQGIDEHDIPLMADLSLSVVE